MYTNQRMAFCEETLSTIFSAPGGWGFLGGVGKL